MEFKIESGVPYAPKVGGRGRKPTYFPLEEMQPGDSFLIALDPNNKKAIDSWRRKLLTFRKKYHKVNEAFAKQVFRTSTEAGGLRVHRTR